MVIKMQFGKKIMARPAILLMMFSFFLVSSDGFAKWHGGSCVDEPGDNRTNPAPLDKEGRKAHISGSARHPEEVRTTLLRGPLKKIAELCGLHSGQKLVVNSGFRDCSGNTRVGGKTKSRHLVAKAADIRFCPGKTCAQMEQILKQAGCQGIGLYPTFVQCDIGGNRHWGSCGGGRKHSARYKRKHR